MKKKNLKKAIAIGIALLLYVVLAIAMKNTGISQIECGDCGGTGLVEAVTADGQTVMMTCETCGGEGIVETGTGYYATFMSLVPPLLAIALALITKEVYSSLFIGVLAGMLLYGNFNPVRSFDALNNSGLIDAVSGTAGIFVFLVILGIMVALINRTGGSAAFGRWAQKNIKSKVGAAICTFVLGVLIFIDDYFNCLTVGSVMRPVTDSKKISRAKLAYLIDATAAPVCMIAPISSWAAAVAEYTGDVGGDVSSFSLFCQAIPYNFYSLLTFVFILAITFMKFDFGPMRLHEKNADKGDLFTFGTEVITTKDEEANPNGRVLDLVLPILVLIGVSVVSLIYVGGFFDSASGNYCDFVGSFGDTDATVGLPLAGIVALLFTFIYLICRKLVNLTDAMKCIPEGFKAMVPAILILTLATALKTTTGLLGSSEFVADALANAGSLAKLLPAIIFIVACVIAFATGTSWGTFGILIPIVLGVFANDPTLMIIGMSACLAGSVCGDHCSPISDTTIMSSAGAQCEHVNHVSTQLPYAITVAAISFICFILAGLIQNAWIVLAIGVALTLGTLFVIKKITLGKEA